MYSLKDKRVWIAGHSGMVGSALVWRLRDEPCEILTTDIDLRVQADVRDWVFTNRPEVVILAAAKVGGIGANAAAPAEFFYDNMMIAANVMHAAYEAKVERLLFLGSSCIYPRNCPQPMQEAMLLSGALEPTNEAYALAKIGGVKMAQFYRAQYGCDFFSAMPCNLYGYGDRYDDEGSHVIPALIMRAHKAKLNGDKVLSVWGSGAPLREFLFADDLADGLVRLLHDYEGGGVVNIGSGQEISIGALARMICDVVGFEGDIVFDDSRPDGSPRKFLASAVMGALGWRAQTDLRVGLMKSYEDYLARYETIPCRRRA